MHYAATKLAQKTINPNTLSPEYQIFSTQTISQTFPQSIVVNNFIC